MTSTRTASATPCCASASPAPPPRPRDRRRHDRRHERLYPRRRRQGGAAGAGRTGPPRSAENHPDDRRLARQRCRQGADRSRRAGAPHAVPVRSHAARGDQSRRGDVSSTSTCRKRSNCCARGQIAPIDIAIIEAIAITDSGAIIPTTSVGNSASFAILADKVIVEINLAQSLALEGLHDIFIPKHRPQREPMPLMTPQRPHRHHRHQIPPEKIAAIVITEKRDSCFDHPGGRCRHRRHRRAPGRLFRAAKWRWGG